MTIIKYNRLLKIKVFQKIINSNSKYNQNVAINKWKGDYTGRKKGFRK